MKKNQPFYDVGSLIKPNEKYCSSRNNKFYSNGSKYVKNIYVKVCSIPNRERPIKFSKRLYPNETAIVLQQSKGKRFPMIKVLCYAENELCVGWVLMSQIEHVTKYEAIDDANV